MSHVYRDEWPEKYSITLGNGHKFHWISRGKKDSRRSIYCLLCNTEFSAAHAGAGAITQHIKGKKHTEKAENKKNSVRLEVSNNAKKAKEVEKDAEPERRPVEHNDRLPVQRSRNPRRDNMDIARSANTFVVQKHGIVGNNIQGHVSR